MTYSPTLSPSTTDPAPLEYSIFWGPTRFNSLYNIDVLHRCPQASRQPSVVLSTGVWENLPPQKTQGKQTSNSKTRVRLDLVFMCVRGACSGYQRDAHPKQIRPFSRSIISLCLFVGTLLPLLFC